MVVIGAGKAHLESAALFKEAGIEVEVIARDRLSTGWDCIRSCITWA